MEIFHSFMDLLFWVDPKWASHYHSFIQFGRSFIRS